MVHKDKNKDEKRQSLESNRESLKPPEPGRFSQPRYVHRPPAKADPPERNPKEPRGEA